MCGIKAMQKKNQPVTMLKATPGKENVGILATLVVKPQQGKRYLGGFKGIMCWVRLHAGPFNGRHGIEIQPNTRTV